MLVDHKFILNTTSVKRKRVHVFLLENRYPWGTRIRGLFQNYKYLSFLLRDIAKQANNRTFKSVCYIIS